MSDIAPSPGADRLAPLRPTESLYTADFVVVDGQAKAGWGILVDKGEILAVGPRKELDRPDVRMVAFAGRALQPGCANAHAHSFQSLLRGLGDDLPFDRWRTESLFRVAPKLGAADVYAGALFAFSEMLLYGITTVCDFFYLNAGGNDHARAVVRAAHDLGIRLTLARSFYDWDAGPREFRETPAQARDRFLELRKEFADDRRVSVIPAPHSLHAASEAMIRSAVACAAEASIPWHMHLAEEKSQVDAAKDRYGVTPLRALDKMGVLGERSVIVHGCWLDKGERALLAEKKGKLVVNPAANMFLGDGTTDVIDLRKRGVTVALGTDGGCTNSRVSIFDEMRTCALVQKLNRLDGGAITAEEVLAMGAAAGGEALGLPLGRIAPGQRADFVLLDLDDLSLWPIQGLVKNVVYAQSHRAVQDVVVEGEIVVRDRQLVKVPLGQVRDKIREATKDLGPTP
ncbi:MAG: amidohydrolase family protein [Myxococcota bacterium]